MGGTEQASKAVAATQAFSNPAGHHPAPFPRRALSLASAPAAAPCAPLWPCCGALAAAPPPKILAKPRDPPRACTHRPHTRPCTHATMQGYIMPIMPVLCPPCLCPHACDPMPVPPLHVPPMPVVPMPMSPSRAPLPVPPCVCPPARAPLPVSISHARAPLPVPPCLCPPPLPPRVNYQRHVGPWQCFAPARP